MQEIKEAYIYAALRLATVIPGLAIAILIPAYVASTGCYRKHPVFVICISMAAIGLGYTIEKHMLI